MHDGGYIRPIVSVFGRFVDVDKTNKRRENALFARVCVEIDVRKPIPNRVWVNTSDPEDSYWQYISVEGSLKFCSHCRLHGHEISECRKKIAREERRKVSKGMHNAQPTEATVVVGKEPAAEKAGQEWQVVTNKKAKAKAFQAVGAREITNKVFLHKEVEAVKPDFENKQVSKPMNLIVRLDGDDVENHGDSTDEDQPPPNTVTYHEAARLMYAKSESRKEGELLLKKSNFNKPSIRASFKPVRILKRTVEELRAEVNREGAESNAEAKEDANTSCYTQPIQILKRSQSAGNLGMGEDGTEYVERPVGSGNNVVNLTTEVQPPRSDGDLSTMCSHDDKNPMLEREGSSQ